MGQISPTRPKFRGKNMVFPVPTMPLPPITLCHECDLFHEFEPEMGRNRENCVCYICEDGSCPNDHEGRAKKEPKPPTNEVIEYNAAPLCMGVLIVAIIISVIVVICLRS